MKKVLATILSLLMVLTIIPIAVSVSADTDGYYTYSVSNEKATITKCDKSISGDITIPSTLGGCPVTSIGDSAFRGCSSLTNITIPNSVTSIGEWAFYSCKSLTSITIPNSVTSIGWYAFDRCTSLTSITIPNSVTSIGEWAFRGCSSLTSITVNDNNKNYCDADGVLYNKDKTELICYPVGKTDRTFVIPNSVTSIGSGAFEYCTSLTSITIPNSVKSIGNSVFSGCNKIKTLYIPDSVEQIGTSALANTTSLTDLYYGGSKRKWLEQVYPTSDKDLLYVNIHFDAKVVTKNAKKATYFAKGYTGDKVVGSIVLEKGKAIAKLKLKTPKITVTAGKKLFKVKYKKVKAATGFQVRYRIKGKWKYKKFNSKKTVTKTINKLKKGSKYTVQIRAFKKSGKKIVYSAWSKTQKVTIK